MAANFWRSSHCIRWLYRDEKEIQRAQPKDVAYFKSKHHVHRLRLFFINELQRIGKECHLRNRVVITAIVFFRRFYVKENFVDHDPRIVIRTLLFLASKVEECGMNVVKFVPRGEWLELKPHYLKLEILRYEFICLEVLNFDLIVYQPFRDLTQYLSDAKLTECMQTAWNIVNDAYRTDVCLLYPPYLIAITAIYMACVFSDKNSTDWLNSLNIKITEVHNIAKMILELYDTSERYTKLQPVEKDLLPLLLQVYEPTMMKR